LNDSSFCDSITSIDTPTGAINMNTNQAKQQGAAAFKAGKGRAPALNQSFLVAADAVGNLLELMKAYTHGWTIASLASCAAVDMPSVRELAEIESA
jgi:hypothetical protein